MVENSQRRYDADEFFSRLMRDDLPHEAATVSLDGMVKKSQFSGARTFEFTISAACAEWTEIPLTLVDTVEVKGSVACDDHSHTLARVTFRTPETAEGKALLSIVTHLAQRTNKLRRLFKFASPPLGAVLLRRRPELPPQEGCVWVCRQTDDAWYCYAVCIEDFT